MVHLLKMNFSFIPVKVQGPRWVLKHIMEYCRTVPVSILHVHFASIHQPCHLSRHTLHHMLISRMSHPAFSLYFVPMPIIPIFNLLFLGAMSTWSLLCWFWNCSLVSPYPPIRNIMNSTPFILFIFHCCSLALQVAASQSVESSSSFPFLPLCIVIDAPSFLPEWTLFSRCATSKCEQALARASHKRQFASDNMQTAWNEIIINLITRQQEASTTHHHHHHHQHHYKQQANPSTITFWNRSE